MSLEDFVTKYNGKYIDYDGVYGFQCVDLIRQWVKEGLAFPPSSLQYYGNAQDIFKQFPDAGNEYFTKVYNNFNDTTQVPPKNAIVFWGYPYGFYVDWKGVHFAGHTSICSQAWGTGLITFDENWGNPNFCKYVNHNYRGCLGWLVPKQ